VNFVKDFKLVNFYEKYKAHIKGREQEAAVELLVSLFSREEFVMPHPLLEGVFGRCIDSRKIGLTNIVFFSDKERGEKWAIIQITSFVNAIVIGDDCYIFLASPIDIIEELFKESNRKLWEPLYEEKVVSKKFGGFLVDQKLPYHFFYDALVNSIEYLKNVDGALFYSGVEGDFIGVEELFGERYGGMAREEECYAYPAVINGMRVFGKNDKFMQQVEEMEERILSLDSPKCADSKSLVEKVRSRKNEGAAVFWYGVSNGKRKWHQQVETSLLLAKALLEENPSVIMLVDGFTSPSGEFNSESSDTRVLDEIVSGLSGFDGIEVASLIGHDYNSKIAACKECDFFVSYSGTGAFVPLRVCKIPGVVHKNERLFSFPDDYGDKVSVLQGEDCIKSNGKPSGPGYIDYKIPCQNIIYEIIELRRKGFISCRVGGEVALSKIFKKYGLKENMPEFLDELSRCVSVYNPEASDLIGSQAKLLRRSEVDESREA
jgi:hypothetical protein